MNFSDIVNTLEQIGLPLLGAALPIPGGAAMGEALAKEISSPSAKPEDIIKTLTTNADALQKAKEFESQHTQIILQAVFAYQAAQTAAQSNIVIAEAKGEDRLQRDWRPITMIGFLVLLFLYWFGIEPHNVTQATIDQVFGLLKIGMGGYIVGRSGEKIAASVVQTLKK